MSEVLYFEQKVAERLGISRRDFKYLCAEALQKKGGRVRHGREVALTQDGLDAILRHLHASSNRTADFDFSLDRVPDAEAEKTGPADGTNGTAETDISKAPPARPQLVELTVQRIYPNEKLLQARTGAGELVTVGVKSNKNFRPFDHRGRKMTLQARLVRPGRYEMEGRCPRFPGRY